MQQNGHGRPAIGAVLWLQVRTKPMQVLTKPYYVTSSLQVRTKPMQVLTKPNATKLNPMQQNGHDRPAIGAVLWLQVRN